MIFMPLGLLSQNMTVKGKIIDDKQEPLIGATVVELNNVQNATMTDVDGDFTIQVKKNQAELKISYIGFVDKFVKGSTEKFMTITLDNDSQMLNEVVTVAYGQQKRITHVGSTSQISSKEIQQSPSASIQNALVGRLPGLFQQQTSGQPGADAANIYIRGVSTFANVSKSPLVLIDDIETDYSTLSQLDPNEVDNIAILKDASSTAIYGVKGANGVILVTTKRGIEGPAKITFRSEYGIQKPTVYNQALGSYDSLDLLIEYFENMGKNPEAELPGGLIVPANSEGTKWQPNEHFKTGDMPYIYPDINWYDQIMRNSAMQTRQNVDISGGVKDVKYFVSLGYVYQDGILKDVDKTEDFNNNYYLRRYNLRSNTDIDATKDLKISINLSAILNEKNEPYMPDPRVDGGGWPLWRRLAAGQLNPYLFPVKNENGSYAGVKGFSTNPVMLLQYAGYKREFRNNINGNISAEHKLDFLTKGLKIKGTMALTNTWGYRRSLTRSDFPDYSYNKTTGKLDKVSTNSSPLPPLSVNASGTADYISPMRKIISQFILSYAHKFGDHNVSGLALATWDTSRSGNGDPANFNGYSGRISYDYKYRYILEVNAGYNGSDRFKSKNKYGFFPAIAGGWNISEEPFFQNELRSLYVVDFLKIRASYGLVGSDAISGNRYLYLEQYERKTGDSDGYFFGENPQKISAIYPGQLGNNNVTWEKENKLDIGAELRMFNQKLSLGFDYFSNERYDILTNRATVPSLVGLSAPPANIGRVRNRGFEFEGTFRDKIGKVDYFLTGNFSLAKNKILEMDEAEIQMYPNLRKTGRPVGQIYGYICDGFYMDEEDIANHPDLTSRGDIAPGDLKYRDVSGPNGVPDGIIDSYDMVPIGNPVIPQINYGISTGFSYENFDFSILFQGAAKGSIMSQEILQMGGVNGRPREIHLDRWTEENKYNAKFPRLGGKNDANSTFWLRPNDYIRLKNIELGYNVPPAFVKKFKMSSLRLYANGANLITWSKLKIYDVDPESNSGGSAAYSNYPQMKLFNFGLQVTF